MALTTPDIEAAIVAHLNGLAEHVATRVRNPRPPTFIRVTRQGGRGRNLITSDIRVLIECWAGDETTALGLARNAYARIWSGQHSWLAGRVWVGGIGFNEPVQFPDPDAPELVRFQFLISVTVGLEQMETSA